MKYLCTSLVYSKCRNIICNLSSRLIRKISLYPVDAEISEINRENVIDTKELTETIDDYKIVDLREKEEYDGAVLYGEANPLVFFFFWTYIICNFIDDFWRYPPFCSRI